MVNLLRKLFIKNYDDVKNQHVREAHGKMSSLVGVVSNLFLFAIKLVAGLFSKSLSIIADSVNNLSDMGSSVVTLIGFRMSNKPADKEHPYGHQRIEYIAGLIVSIIIIFVGGSLLVTSVEKIFNYQYEEIPEYISYISIGILAISILVKIWQALFNKKVGKLIDSVALEAVASDSRNDVIATSAILIGTIIMLFVKNIPFSIDGILGVLVSLFIIISGIKMIKETTDPLIGCSVPYEYVSEVVSYVKMNSYVLGVHDVVCHNYGPTKVFMTLHAEVDSKGDILTIHENIDNIESEVNKKYGIELTIHMDPIEIDNEELNHIRDIIELSISKLNKKIYFHDLRIVIKSDISTILFDVVVPYNYELSNDEIKEILTNDINSGEKKYNVIIHFDNMYTEEHAWIL